MNGFGKLMLAAVIVLISGYTALGFVTTDYLGTDSEYLGETIQGTWVGKVGAEGYHLLYWNAGETQKSYPSYVNEATPAGDFAKWQWVGPGGTIDDLSAVSNAAQTQRCASCWYCGTGYIHMTMKADASFILGVSMLDWGNSGRTADLAVTIAANETTVPAQVSTGAYDTGKWFFWQVRQRGCPFNSREVHGRRQCHSRHAQLRPASGAGVRRHPVCAADVYELLRQHHSIYRPGCLARRAG